MADQEEKWVPRGSSRRYLSLGICLLIVDGPPPRWGMGSLGADCLWLRTPEQPPCFNGTILSPICFRF